MRLSRSTLIIEKTNRGGNEGWKTGVRRGEVVMESGVKWVNSEVEREGGI